MRRLIITSCLFAALVGCSSSAFEGAVGKSEKDGDDDDDDDVVQGDDDVLDDPQVVAGAFLVCEKSADAPEADPATELTVGCYVDDDAGHVDVSTLSPAWTVKDEAGADQPLKNPADQAGYHMNFILPKALVSTYTISVRLSEGGSTQDVSVKLEGIESGVVTSKPYVMAIEIKESNSVCELSFVNGNGDFKFRWDKAQIDVFGLVNVSLCYVLTLSDGTKQDGQILYEVTTFKNEGGGQLPGDWQHVVGYDSEKSSIEAVGVQGGLLPDLTKALTRSTDLLSGMPKFGFTGLSSMKILVAGPLPIEVSAP